MHPSLAVGATLLATALALAAAPAAAQPAAAPPDLATLMQSAERIGSGRFIAWRVGANLLLELPPAQLGKPMLWYTEAVAVPAGVVVETLEASNSLVQLERQGSFVHVRDLSGTQKRRAGVAEPAPAVAPGGVPGAAARDPKRRPIELAVAAGETGALVASFPILGAKADGALLVDLTGAFSNDIPAVTGRGFVARAGGIVAAVDPSKSYIQRVRVHAQALNIRSHLTYLAQYPAAPAMGPQPVSVVLGHSLVMLPDTPMAARPSDPRVGYFPNEFTEFEAAGSVAQARRSVISRFRLEKANPAAAISDPVKPITYYLGPGIPERWKPHIAAGVLQWLPAFEAAGFSNALRVVDAPSPAQDPDWSPEDLSINVIRWVPEEKVNAMGPHVVDPRSGETLSAHIHIWPSVIDFFGQYYWALFGGSGVDPAAAKLPLSTDKAGALMSYIVAHEVGHTLGLMHNQIASTAHGVAQMRNPDFANRFGPNSSIMAYGRFNQVAQPGDGVTQLWSVLGPYDLAAIRYGYGVFGTDPASEQRALAAFAEGFSRDRRLFFGSEESGELISRFGRDPRVQTENTGAERVLATRLGVANLQRSLARLDAGTGGDAKLYASTYDVVLGRHVTLLQSVKRLLGGALPPLGPGEGPTVRLVPAAEQRAAVQYLLGEGAASLEPYAAPAVVERVAVFGGDRGIDRLQAGLVSGLMDGATVALLESQKRRDPAAYSSMDFGRDLQGAVWGDLKAASPTQRALQRGWLDGARGLLMAWAKGGDATEVAGAKALAGLNVSGFAARALAETGDDTLFIPWLRGTLPDLKARLEAASRAAADEGDRLHYGEMAVQVGRLLKLGA
jgi:hypothetical protein